MFVAKTRAGEDETRSWASVFDVMRSGASVFDETRSGASVFDVTRSGASVFIPGFVSAGNVAFFVSA